MGAADTPKKFFSWLAAISTAAPAVKPSTTLCESPNNLVVEFRGLGLKSDTPEQRAERVHGSSYPFRPMAQSITDYPSLGFKEGVIDDVMYNNANRVLTLKL